MGGVVAEEPKRAHAVFDDPRVHARALGEAPVEDHRDALARVDRQVVVNLDGLEKLKLARRGGDLQGSVHHHLHFDFQEGPGVHRWPVTCAGPLPNPRRLPAVLPTAQPPTPTAALTSNTSDWMPV